MAGSKKRAAGGSKGMSTSSSVAKRKAGDWRPSMVPMKTLVSLQKDRQIPPLESSGWRKPEKDEEVPHPRVLPARPFDKDHLPTENLEIGEHYPPLPEEDNAADLLNPIHGLSTADSSQTRKKKRLKNRSRVHPKLLSSVAAVKILEMSVYEIPKEQAAPSAHSSKPKDDDPKTKKVLSPKDKTLSRDKEIAGSGGQAAKATATPVSQMRPEITRSSPDPLSTPSAKAIMDTLSEYGRRLILAESECEKLRQELEASKDMEQQLKSAQESSTELAEVKSKLEKMETEGQAHDDELRGLLVPVAEALSGVLGVPLSIPGKIQVDALMDVVTQVQAHGVKSKAVLKEVSDVLTPLFSRLFPGHPMPSTTPDLVKAFLDEDDPLRGYYLA